MAKRKSLRSLTEEIQSSNTSVNDSIKSLDERVRFLEDTSLAIIALVKKIQQPKITNTKSLKTVAPKDKNSPAGDPLIAKQNDNTTEGLLTKIYMFLTKKSDNDKKERNRRLKAEKEKEKQLEKRYEKVFKSMGFKRKKRGMLGKVGTGIKWLSWGAIGLSLAGIAYMFKEEIIDSAKSVKESITSFADFLRSRFDFVAQIFNSIKTMIMESPVFKWASQKYNEFAGDGVGVKEFITQKIDLVISQVETMVKSLYEDISNWVAEIVRPFVEFVKDPEEWVKTRSQSLARLGLIMMGGPIGFTARASEIEKLAGKATGGIEEFYMKKTHGEETYNKAKDFLESFPEDFAKRVIKDFLTSTGDMSLRYRFGSVFGKKGFTEEEKQLAITLIIKQPELRNQLISATKNVGKYYGGVTDIVGNVSGQIGGESRQEQVEKQLKSTGPELQTKGKEIDLSSEKYIQDLVLKNLEGYQIVPGMRGITLKDKDNNYINSINNPVDFGRIVAKAMFYEGAGKKKAEFSGLLQNFMTDAENHPWIKTAKEELGKVENKALELKPQVQSSVEQFKQTSSDISATASQYYEGAKTPEDKVAATVSLAGRGLAEIGDLFVNKSRPSAEKIDLAKIINQGIDAIDKSFSQASEISTMLGKEGGFEEFIGKVLPGSDTTGQLLPELKRDTISPDPNDDPNNIWKGIQESWAMPSISNNVMNTGKSTSQSISQGSISSRMNTGSFRECSALNYHACVP